MDADNFIDFEEQVYVNPQKKVDETSQFIENLRNLQQQDTERISQETYNLGTQIPSNLGGLTGAEATFAERYQTPQTEQAINALKATTQAEALTTALNNLKSQLNTRYQDAYSAAKKRAASRRSYSGGGGGGSQSPATTPANSNYVEGNVNIDNGVGYNIPGTLRTNAPGTTVVSSFDLDSYGNPISYIIDNETGKTIGKITSDGTTEYYKSFAGDLANNIKKFLNR